MKEMKEKERIYDDLERKQGVFEKKEAKVLQEIKEATKKSKANPRDDIRRLMKIHEDFLRKLEELEGKASKL